VGGAGEATVARFDSIARGFLRYLYEETGFRPEVAGFFTSRHGRAQDPPVTLDELAGVVSLLRERELVATGSEQDGSLPFRAGLTGTGLICVSDHDADIDACAGDHTPPAVRQIKPRPCHDDRAEPRIDPVVPSQPSPAGFLLEGLARVARVLLLTLPAVQPTYNHDKKRVGNAAQRLLDATRQPNADPRRIRLLTQTLRTELATGSLANTLGVVLLDGLDEALRESGLP
jgi:hypothetical protein